MTDSHKLNMTISFLNSEWSDITASNPVFLIPIPFTSWIFIKCVLELLNLFLALLPSSFVFCTHCYSFVNPLGQFLSTVFQLPQFVYGFAQITINLILMLIFSFPKLIIDIKTIIWF